jgi:hypothetical protein
MFKNGFLILIAILFTSLAQAQSPQDRPKRGKMTWEEIDLKCQNFDVQKRMKNKKVCDKAGKIVTSHQKKEKYPFIALRLFTDYSFTDYEVHDKVNNANASIVSKSHIKINARLVQHYSPGFKTYLGIGYQDLIFENSLNKPIVNNHLNLWDFHGGLIFNPFNRLSLDLSAHYGDVYYIRGQGPSNLKFSQHLVPSFNLRGQFDLFTYGSLDFGLGGNIGYTLPFKAEHREEPEGNFDVKGSLNYGAEVFARKQFERWSLGGGIGFNRKEMPTSISDGELTEVTVGLKIAIPFGWNEGK